jgi:hypothetical protein
MGAQSEIATLDEVIARLDTVERELERVAELVPVREWLDSKAAADYLGVTRRALYHYVADRGLVAYQDEPHGKLWFKRSVIDSWRSGSPYVEDDSGDE